MTYTVDAAALANSFKDVRQAYRLVSAYQDRVLKMMGFLADQFPEVSYYHWSPAFCDLPSRKGSTSPAKRSPDEMLPFYSASIFYLPVANHDPHKSSWMLEIHHRADAGKFNEHSRPSGGDPDPAAAHDAASGSSELHLVAWLRDATADNENWYYAVWKPTDWPSDEDILSPVSSGKFSRIRRSVNLKDLANREAVEEMAKNFRKLLKKEGFPLEQLDPDELAETVA